MKNPLLVFALTAAFGLSGADMAHAQGQIVRLNENDALMTARTALAAGDLDRAIAAARKLRERRQPIGPSLARDGEISRATQILCIAERLAGNFETALDECTRAIRLAPRDWRSYVNRGALHYEAGDAASALKDFERAERLAPGEPAVRLNLSLARQSLAAR